ncbi:MAG: hypothetical protein L0220_00190, partial [Acidobacteria bacterium]|nr:hypothetical protein [Acidobacteriota bacterium]
YRETGYEELRSERASSKRLIATKIDRNSQPLLRSPNQENEILPLNAASFVQSGELVIGSSGRGALINSASNLREAVARPRPYFVTSLFADGNRVWIGEQASRQAGGLWVLNNETLSKSAINIRAITALHGSNSELWAGTNRQGAFLLKLEGENAKLIEHLTYETTDGGLRSNQIFTIFRDHEGIVWFGTDHGVCRYDRDSFRSANISNDPQSNVVWSLLRALSGETYAGTNRGLFRLSTDANDADYGIWSEVTELQGYSVYTLYEDKAGGVWAGTDGGLFVRPVESSGFSRFSPTPETIVTIENETDADSANLRSEIPNLRSRESVRAFATFREGLYVALFGRGIEKLEISKDSRKRELVLSNVAAQRAICFAVEGKKALWFGTIDGELHRFDGSQTTSYVMPKKQSGTLSDRSVRAIQIAGERIWIGTSQGLYVREDDTIRNVIPDVDVRALLVMREDSQREIVWCATKNTGLLKFLPDKNLTARFNTEQGLTSEQVFALASSNNDIWIGTNRGVVRHHPSSIEPRLQVTRLVADRIYLPDDLTAELSLPHTMQSLLLEVTGISSRTFPSQFQYEFILQKRSGQELQKIKTHDPH